MKNILKNLFLGKVMYGPFAGMNYLGATKTTTPLPKVLGIYERELQPVLASIATRLRSKLVVVGAAEGYYAVGLLRNHPDLRAVAFELDDHTRGLLKRMADLNAVSGRLTIKGACTQESLKCCLTEAPTDLVLMDIEGAENEILDPRTIPELRQCAILVEVHDHIVPGTKQELLKRFTASHEVQNIASSKRQPKDIPHLLFRFLARIPGYFERTMLWERTKPTSWLYLSPLRPAGK
jgi:predicted O-methyltransferase YrrM